MKWRSCIAACLMILLLMSQRSTAEPPLPGAETSRPKNGRSASPAPFLNQSREVPPRLEWNREVISRKGGTISFRVTSQGPFAVTVVTGKGYNSFRRGDRAAFIKQDVRLTVDSSDTTYDGRVTLLPGSSWFIIENQTDIPVTITLQCFALP